MLTPILVAGIRAHSDVAAADLPTWTFAGGFAASTIAIAPSTRGWSDWTVADDGIAGLIARRGDAVAGPWRLACDAARNQPDLPPLRHVLFGLNAHINFDLPQALLAVISPADFANPSVLRSREADHGHVDAVLQARVGAEDDELNAVSARSLLDRLLRPANRTATRRFLAEARAKVWRNAVVLDRARRVGSDDYASALAVLEERATARVRDLTRPGHVLISLARKGFGVLMPGA